MSAQKVNATARDLELDVSVTDPFEKTIQRSDHLASLDLNADFS